MRASDVPRILRESPEVARAREEGERAGRAGVAADQNPWMEKEPAFATGYSNGWRVHAVRRSTARYASGLCGAPELAQSPMTFFPDPVSACKRCLRAVEAERKRRATAWE